MVTIWKRAAIALAVLMTASACGSTTDLVESDPTGRAATAPTASTSPTDPSRSTPTSPSPPPTPPAAAEPKVGECRRTDPIRSALGGSLEVRKPVPCGEIHNAETYFVGLMNEQAQAAARSGNATRLRSLVAGICGRQLADWLGGSGEDVALSVFDFVVGAPRPKEVGPSARWYSCDAYAIRAMNGLKLTGLPRTTKGVLSSARADAWTQCNRGGFEDGTNIVVCSKTHSYRAVAGIHLGDLNARYPGSNSLESRLKDQCTSRVRAYLDNTTAGFNYGVTWPSLRQWNTGDRWGICYAETAS
jgi:Septum formation